MARTSLRQQWNELRRGRPGRRFQARYRRAKESHGKRGFWERAILFAVAVVCLAISVVLSVMPGPAILFFFIAGGLLASESLAVARFMDWTELKIRAAIHWARRKWRARRRPA